MAADVFLKLGDIKGESSDDKHKGEIDVLAWSWGVSNAASMATGGGGGLGKASFHDLTITHYIDKASPNLLKMCATGEHIKEATLTQRKQGKGQQEYLLIKLTDVMVSSVQDGGTGDQLTENFTLAFAISGA